MNDDDDDDDGRRNVKLESRNFSLFENGSGIFRKKLGNLHHVEFERL